MLYVARANENSLIDFKDFLQKMHPSILKNNYKCEINFLENFFFASLMYMESTFRSFNDL